MFKQSNRTYNSPLADLLDNLTAHSLKVAAKDYEKTVAQMSCYAGRLRLDMGFVQQEDVSFIWVNELNTQGLVCSFALGHEILLQISDHSLNLQRLKWQLVYPANTLDDIRQVSDNYLLDTALFQFVSKGYDDKIADVIEAAIVEMAS